jgi:hypothetical protein
MDAFSLAEVKSVSVNTPLFIRYISVAQKQCTAFFFSLSLEIQLRNVEVCDWLELPWTKICPRLLPVMVL